MPRTQMTTDHFGREIKAGNIITYPVRRGSNMWTEHGKVLDVQGEVISLQKSDGRTVSFRSPERAVIVGAKQIYRDFNQSLAAA